MKDYLFKLSECISSESRINTSVITISDDMDYFANRHALESMYSECLKDPYIQNNSMKFWYPAFKNYLQTSSDPFVSYQLNSSKYCGIW